jgi:hypothetical protein
MEEFETAYDLIPSKICSDKHAEAEFSASPDFHHIVLNGEEYHLGDVQACIIHQLHDAASCKNHWVHGKTLLHSANSKALRLRDVFKSKRDWGRLVISNNRGYYRLNIEETALEKKKTVGVSSIVASALLYLQNALGLLPECLPILFTV